MAEAPKGPKKSEEEKVGEHGMGQACSREKVLGRQASYTVLCQASWGRCVIVGGGTLFQSQTKL